MSTCTTFADDCNENERESDHKMGGAASVGGFAAPSSSLVFVLVVAVAVEAVELYNF